MCLLARPCRIVRSSVRPFLGLSLAMLLCGWVTELSAQSVQNGGVAFDVPAMATCYALPDPETESPQVLNKPSQPTEPELERAHLARLSLTNPTIVLTSARTVAREQFVGNPAPSAASEPATIPAPLSPSTSRLTDRFALPAVTPGQRSFLLAIDTTVIFSDPTEYETVLFEVFPLSRSWQIQEYWPRSMSATNYEGPISEERKEDGSAGIVGDLNGGIPGYADLRLHLDGGTKSNVLTRQQQKAPHTQVVTSGLTQRGQGAFFKFNRSHEFMIEGGHRLEVMFQVPRSWQGDIVQVHCRAVDRDGNMQSKNFLMALSVYGDEQGSQRARQFALADQSVQSLLSRWQVHRRPSHLLEGLQSAFSNQDTPDKEAVQRTLLTASRKEQIPGFHRLPETMQDAIVQALAAKVRMLELAGQR